MNIDISNSFYLKDIPLLQEFSTYTTPYKLHRTEDSSINLEFYNNLKTLENIFEFNNSDDIKRFILKHRELLEILLNADNEIHKIFGSNVRLQLELHTDPEEEWDELFIIIKSPYSAEKAIELEKKLFNEWFINIIDKVNNKLNFAEEPL